MTSWKLRAAGAVAALAVVVTAAAPAQADPRVGGDIGLRYESLGGAGGLLGHPTTPEIRTPDGRGAYVQFERGSIYWSPATGSWEVHGDVRAAWGRHGWENGPLGFPVSNETRTDNGRGAYNVFQGGTVYWSPQTGARAVRGAIHARYGTLGWEEGRLGFPVTDEVRTPNGRGAYNVFQGGSIYWSPDSGAHPVVGEIRNAYGRAGWEGGCLGFPVTHEGAFPELELPPGAVVQLFQGGIVGFLPGEGVATELWPQDPELRADGLYPRC
ncbi:LGFP repeat-containing protein [Kineococcus xinjiangensis]|uniref:LGFP repeat-containing protein n=1 Tax=Kineococcus xinjiangensis TaxID=512762 RepID=A0A2S6IW82_9ACTN|nr:hypothetical protein [Kineococcus xinjiangensis]PPK98617.1 LGFP repeat-containing protein [Kineococcus xinjiangensis]